MSAVGGARDRADGVSRWAVERRKRWNGMFLGAESWWKRGGRRGRRRSALYNDDGGLYVKGGGATLAPPAEYQCGWDGEGMEWLTACPDISPRRTQADRQSQAYRRVGTACIDSTPPLLLISSQDYLSLATRRKTRSRLRRKRSLTGSARAYSTILPKAFPLYADEETSIHNCRLL